MTIWNIEFSIYGANAGWRSSITSTFQVEAENKEDAQTIALKEPGLSLTPEAIRSITIA